jgi:hypothetical protein
MHQHRNRNPRRNANPYKYELVGHVGALFVSRLRCQRRNFFFGGIEKHAVRRAFRYHFTFAVVRKFQSPPLRVDAQFFWIHNSDVREGDNLGCRADQGIVCHNADAAVPRRRDNQSAASEVRLNAVISIGRMPEYQDRLRVELQRDGGAADAQNAPRFCREPIAIINCASDGSRGFTHVRAVGVRDHAQRHDFGRWWSENQQMRRCYRRKLATKNRIGLTEGLYSPGADFSAIRQQL